MMLPDAIRPAVGQSLITKVSRLFNGTIDDVLAELLQNARRAGATSIDLDILISEDGPWLLVRDDGDGIADPATLLTLGQSGWDAGIAAREDPAGMGVFSLAGRAVTVQSYSRTAACAWKVEIPADGWEGKLALPIERSSVTCGTWFEIALSPEWTRQLESAAEAVARFYPLPVRFGGDELPREDFLARAVHVEEWQGCRIGVFHDSVTEATDAPRINFHGVTVPCRLPTVGEVDNHFSRRVRVDIVDAPALQLVLPARKEMVENAALEALRIAALTAIFRSVVAAPTHRLSFANWCKARDLGVELPEAEAWLNGWLPITADSYGRHAGPPIRDGSMVIMSAQEADVEQALARAFGKDQPLGGRPVIEERAFAGYAWYDRLPRAEPCVFTIERDGVHHRYGDEDTLPDDFETGPVASITAEIPVLPDASPHAEAVVVAVPCDALACTGWSSDLDDSTILIVDGAPIEPADLANFIDAGIFSAADDGGCDSWETQHEAFSRQSYDLANRLLLGEEAALTARLRAAFFDHLRWLVPADRTLHLAFASDTLDLALPPAA